MSSPTTPDPTYAGQAVYTPLLLAAYDIGVLRFSASFLWGCSRTRLIGHYNEHVSSPHLDIGVGTGHLLDCCRFPTASPDITLMDLNEHSLRAATRRLRRYAPRTHIANVLEPFGLPPASFGSVGMNYLVHCLPGTLDTKAAAFAHGKEVLVAGGTLFGTTVLGESAHHNWLGRRVMTAYNRKGVFTNLRDDAEELRAGLAEHFERVAVTVVGNTALFAAHD